MWEIDPQSVASILSSKNFFHVQIHTIYMMLLNFLNILILLTISGQRHNSHRSMSHGSRLMGNPEGRCSAHLGSWLYMFVWEPHVGHSWGETQGGPSPPMVFDGDFNIAFSQGIFLQHLILYIIYINIYIMRNVRTSWRKGWVFGTLVLTGSSCMMITATASELWLRSSTRAAGGSKIDAGQQVDTADLHEKVLVKRRRSALRPLIPNETFTTFRSLPFQLPL